MDINLFDCDFGAADGFAGEAADFADFVGDNTVVFGMDCVIAAQLGAFTGALRKADLANNDLASFNHLAAKQLNTKTLANAVACIFGSTTCFNV
jgi:hypothetical protein